MDAESPQRSTLIAAYERLPDAPKAIIRIQALVPGAGRDKLVRAMAALLPRRGGGASSGKGELDECLATLAAAGLQVEFQSYPSQPVQLRCHPALPHHAAVDAMRSPDHETYRAVAKAIVPPAGAEQYSVPDAASKTATRYRLALYINDLAMYLEGREQANRHQFGNAFGWLAKWFDQEPLEAAWLASRALPMQADLATVRLLTWYERGIALPDLPMLLDLARREQARPEFAILAALLPKAALLRLDLAALRQYAAADGPVNGVLAQAALAFLAGDLRQAAELYRSALKALRKLQGRRKLFLEGPHDTLFVLTLLGLNDPALHAEIEAGLTLIADRYDRHYRGPARAGTEAMVGLLCLARGAETQARAQLEQAQQPGFANAIAETCVRLLDYAIDARVSKARHDKIVARFHSLREAMPLLAVAHAEILRATGNAPEAEAFLNSETARACGVSFIGLLSVRQPWERALESLNTLLAPAATAGKAAAKAKEKRLVWMLDPLTREVRPLEQSAKGQGWTGGKPVALKRLMTHDAKLDYLTDHDRRVCATIRRATHYFQADEYTLDHDKAVVALIGHPLVFDACDPALRIELVSYPIELVIDERGGGFHLALSHPVTEAAVLLEAETPDRYRVIEVTEPVLRVQTILGKGLAVPPAGRTKILELAKQANPALPVRAGNAEIGVAAIAGDATPVIQLAARGEQLTVKLVVRPFGAAGPVYLPGLGAGSVLATIEGARQRATRDLQAEAAAMAAFVRACPSLADRLAADSFETDVDGLEAGLEVLLEIQAYAAAGGAVAVEWAEGGRLKVRPVTRDQVAVRVREGRDWFAVSGKITLPGEAVVEMRSLLERLSKAHGRFVPLDDGSFLALTHEVQAQLRRLLAIAVADKAGLRVPVLAAGTVDAALAEIGVVDADAAWRRRVEALRAAEEWTPAPPPLLQAELRDYQLEGFAWMARLARLGAGACLADDMGLGKTVQAIAVMLHRAEEGPCLVVAPTSVVPNWCAELLRFAPSLGVHRLAGAADRAAMVAALGKRDVLICSHGLLHQEAAMLGAMRWQMVVLDEAQAIKNAETKRAQAIHQLEAGFRLALTGTPVENALDELWSLFNFVAPGLLGAREQFQKRFVGPIERGRDAAARQALKTLVRPFLLRRTKALVLNELPPRTETTRLIEMGAEERRFYEALRQRALDELAAPNTGASPGGGKRIKILAEIMRLRRACCAPGLIDPDAPSGAKLAAFLELVEELRASRHKALVFSQFVGHLALVRAALDARGIGYHYLDGSTPSAERERQVAGFQSGGGADLFLISLRAGGSGLNLTAADYVVHLDPWWNPAVEDQASDRAHRIGQTRPVTVYRLVMADSIEEKILGLHRDKRDLAAELLDGTEVSGRLSEQELLELIRV